MSQKGIKWEINVLQKKYTSHCFYKYSHELHVYIMFLNEGQFCLVLFFRQYCSEYEQILTNSKFI